MPLRAAVTGCGISCTVNVRQLIELCARCVFSFVAPRRLFTERERPQGDRVAVGHKLGSLLKSAAVGQVGCLGTASFEFIDQTKPGSSNIVFTRTIAAHFKFRSALQICSLINRTVY